MSCRRFSGTFTSGGNEANFSAWRSPSRRSFQRRWKTESHPRAPVVAYASAESHHSLDKSAGLLGHWTQGSKACGSQRAAPDGSQRSKRDPQDRATGKLSLRGGDGRTTSSGVIDDFPAIAEICRRHDLWMHVDGAYGASVIFSDHYRSLVRGIELADSLTIDPHKWLAVPFAAGVILRAARKFWSERLPSRRRTCRKPKARYSPTTRVSALNGRAA